MDFEFSQDEVRIIEEVRAFLKEEITPELVAETREFEGICGRPEGKKFIKKFAARGWLTPNWLARKASLTSFLRSAEAVCVAKRYDKATISDIARFSPVS